MKIFLDTANIEEIRKAKELGVLGGVTTNPSIIAKEGKNPEDVISEILQIVEGPVNIEVTSLDSAGMILEGRNLAKLSEKVIVKIPMTEEGLKAVKTLSSEGIKTNVTLVFTATQALLAANAGANYVSSFLGRLDDKGVNGTALISEIVRMFQVQKFDVKVIAASVRSPLHVFEAACAGVHIATVPYKVLVQMARHELTDEGLKKFMEDWEKVSKIRVQNTIVL